MLGSFLLALLLTQTQGTWPTATLVYPPDGVLLVGEGRSCNITFLVAGNPFPREKTWYKDGVKITGGSNINIDDSSGGSLQTLRFNSVERSNEGTYWSEVKNIQNLEASKSPNVKLRVTYLDDVFGESNQVVRAKVGEYAVLQCFPPDYFGPSVKFSWSKAGVQLVESDDIYVSEYGNLVIMQVSYDDVGSNYRCTITIDSLREGYQTKQGDAVTLIVENNPQSYIAPQIAMKPMDLNMDAQIKDTFRVECVANGYPNLPSIRWFKEGVAITSSGPIYDLQKRNYLQITIPRSGGNVGGQYRCEATDNTGQRVTATATVNIYTKPIITTGLPTSEVKKSSGSELSLSCVATATPAPAFKWYKNAELLSNDYNTNIESGLLQITNVNTLNRGVYQCEAYNDPGSTVSTGKITIQERLTFVIRPEDVEVFLGTSATFNCMGKGDPGPESLTWQFNGGDPPSDHEFTKTIVNQAVYKIPKVKSSDAGKISCIISSPDNLYPTDTATAILTIRQGPQVSAYEKEITKTEDEQAEFACLVQNANSVTWKWLFKGTLITQPDDLRITVKNNLLQVRQLSAADEGTYTCQADENGLSNSDTIYLTVKTRPVITMDEELRIGEGNDATLRCEAESNPGATISWRRNGQVIQDANSDKYKINGTVAVSELTVLSVEKGQDTGAYSCYATNEIGVSNAEIELVVVAACEVMETPQDQTIEFEGSTTLSCTVNNCPTASWLWSKDGQPIVFDNYRYISRGSSIELRFMVPSDGGVYMCSIDSNDSLNKKSNHSATIKVEVHADITRFPDGERVLFKSGDEVVLECSAHGEYSAASPLVVDWYKSNILQASTKESQYDMNEMIAYVTKTLRIENAIASDAGHYQCVANNMYNVQDKKDTSLMLMTYPDRPGQPYDTWIGAGAVELSWSEPANTGNTPLTSYELQIETSGNSIFRPFMSNLDPLSVNAVIYFLSSNQEYKFQVIAVNQVGKGESSDSSNEIRTFEDQNTPTLNLVTDFTLTAVSSDKINVTWEAPERTTSALRGYKIVYRNENALEPARFLDINDYTMTEASLEDLDAGALYSVQIESNTQVTTRLVVSSTKTVYTFNQRPTAPIDCMADRKATSRLVVTWAQPDNTHGKVLSYKLYFKDKRDSDGQWDSIVHEDPQTTTYVLTLIDDTVDYDLKISASNSAGEGSTGWCESAGRIINLPVYQEWWFYVLVALAGILIIAAIILCALLLYRRSGKKSKPQLQKLPPAKKDEFQAYNPQVYSPSSARPPYNPINTYAGGTAAPPPNNFSPYNSPDATMKFGAGDFRYNQPAPSRGPDYGPRADNYSYNGKKFDTYDSRGGFDSAPPPKSPYGGGRYDPGAGSNYDNTSRYDNNTYDSRYKGGDTASRGGYPGTYGGGGAPSGFKSSQL